MNTKEVLELKHSRELTLADIEAQLPEGRRSGELSGLIASIKQAHKLLMRYDAIESPPPIAEMFTQLFAAGVARIEELITAQAN
jgi:hypothetical protein